MKRGYTLAIQRMYGPGVVRVAARHNLRENAVELGADSHIDATRIRDNINLRGPNTAAGVVSEAKSLMVEAGVTKLRKNAVMALELLIMLPAEANISPREYFERATVWAERHFAVPVLSSVVHLDEAAPHCHVLLLPLVKGKMNGSDLHGGKTKLWAMQASFHEEVSSHYGFVRPTPQKRLGASARAAAMSLLHECFQTNTSIDDSAIDVLLKPHANNPEPLLQALGMSIPPNKKVEKSFVEIMTAECKPDRRNFSTATQNVVGVINTEESKDSNPYTCVGKESAKRTSLANSECKYLPAKVSTSNLAGASTKTIDSKSQFNQVYDFKGKTAFWKGSADQSIVCTDRDGRSVITATDRGVLAFKCGSRQTVLIRAFHHQKPTFSVALPPAMLTTMGDASDPRLATSSNSQCLVPLNGLPFELDIGDLCRSNDRGVTASISWSVTASPRWVQSLHR